MLRSLSRVWILMVLIVVVALGFGAKVHFVDRPERQRKVELYQRLAQLNAQEALSSERQAEAEKDGEFDDLWTSDVHWHRDMEKRYRDAASHPDRPNDLREAEAAYNKRRRAEAASQLDKLLNDKLMEQAAKRSD